MLAYLQSTWLIFNVIVKYIIEYCFQALYFWKNKTIQQIIGKYKSGLDKKDLSRIKDYSIRLYAIFGNYIKIITSHTATSSERHQMTLLGAFTPLFDDFIDDYQDDIETYKMLIKNPFSLKSDLIKYKTALFLYQTLINELSETQLHSLYKSIYKVCLIQYQSRNQKNIETSLSELKKLSFYKGGYSALLCRMMLDKPFIRNEYWFWIEFGGYIQLLDDIFDIRNDLKNGIRTFPNVSASFNEMSTALKADFQKLMSLMSNLVPDKRYLKKLIGNIFFLYLATNGIIEQLKRIQKNKGVSFKPEQLTKRETEYHIWSIINIFEVLKKINELASLLRSVERQKK